MILAEQSSQNVILITFYPLYLSMAYEETPIIGNALHLGINCMFTFSSRKMILFSENSENEMCEI